MISRSLLKEIRNLQQKKHRKLSQRFVAEGEKVVHEFLTEGWQPQRIIAVREWLQQYPQWAERFRSIVHEASEAEMERLTNLKTPSPVLIVLPQRWLPLDELHLSSGWLLGLDAVSDPGNLGTLIRIADWFGLTGIICSPECAEVYAPKVVQASMGSLARVQVTQAALIDVLARFPGLHAVGADATGSISSPRWQPPPSGLLVIGNESRGIRDELKSVLHQTVAIPRYGIAESLNAAVAAAILCYQLRMAVPAQADNC
ncbi:MAG: RNA methyltransferase [Chitinophagales bacterium]|nr:RNA methyltransferase [Chitinophagales bacterium]MDW8392818.1 RNA methyltransferase [Chitinophagales bacterium]